ncbi:MAG: serine dehydratase [Oscillibacter sp.]|nr:serine dehydratase [Oscillibacter sp.]
MSDLRSAVQAKMPLTMGEAIALAKEYDARVVDVVLTENEISTGLGREELLNRVMDEYAHNLKAVELGVTEGNSFLLGNAAAQLREKGPCVCFRDEFLDKALMYTVGAEIGNHCIGVRPCAGTGDSCPYAGFVRAMMDTGVDAKTVAEIAALMLKIGGLFRVGKVTTGCNMEGFGAGAACVAAATVALENGTPEQMEKAMVLAMSPTIGVPCTPRVLVPALCTTHVGGAILIGMYSARICMAVDMNVNVPFDVMIAMASLVHVTSAKNIVPTVVEYMEPFFQRTANVESLVRPEVREAERKQIQQTLSKAAEISKKLAEGAGTVLSTFGEAVVGGSSQAVGSPTNCARIAHELLEDGEKVKKITVELYPELFARRTINIPGVLMGAVYGASTADHEMYEKSVDMVKADGVEVEIVEGQEHGIQKVTLLTDRGRTVQVDTLNRGGGRVVLRDAVPSLELAQEAAKRLGIVVVQ